MLARMANLEIGGAAPDLLLCGADEKPVSLSDVRGGRPLVALFLRHFG